MAKWSSRNEGRRCVLEACERARPDVSNAPKWDRRWEGKFQFVHVGIGQRIGPQMPKHEIRWRNSAARGDPNTEVRYLTRNPAGFSCRSRPAARHGCKSLWWKGLHGRAVPGSSGCIANNGTDFFDGKDYRHANGPGGAHRLD